MKIRFVGAELFHVDREADGRTDMMKLIAVLFFLIDWGIRHGGLKELKSILHDK